MEDSEPPVCAEILENGTHHGEHRDKRGFTWPFVPRTGYAVITNEEVDALRLRIKELEEQLQEKQGAETSTSTD